MLPVEVIEVMYFNFTEDKSEASDFKWPIILLLDETHERVLPIWIGPHEAQLIQMILNNTHFPRPMTWGFVGNLIDAVGAQVESVIVSKLVGEVYYAVTRLRLGDVVHEVDARPSDAIGLALHARIPIFVAEEVMSSAGIVMGDKFKAGLEERKQMSRLSVEELLQRFPPASAPAEVNVKTQEEIETANRESHQRMKALIGQ